MDRIDGLLADRLLAALGGWRGVAAHIRLARRGDRYARMRVEEIAGGELKGVMVMANGRPSDFVRGTVDYALKDPGDVDLIVSADLELAPGIGWNGVHLLARDGALPETVRMALPGHPARDLIDHPGIPPEAILTGVTEIAPDHAFIRIDGVPSHPMPRAGIVQILRAAASSRLHALRAGLRDAKPTETTRGMKIAFAIILLINARLLIPDMWPSWAPLVWINIMSIGACVATIAMRVDLGFKQPVACWKIHLFNAWLKHGDHMKEIREKRGF